MKPSNALWAALAISAAGLGAVLGFVRTGNAQADAELVTCRSDYAVVGIASGERARVHLAWVTSEDPAGDPLNVRVQFIDRAGQLLKEEALTLPANTDVASELVAPKRKEVERTEFRVAVFVQPSSGDPGFAADKGCPDVLTSLELIDGLRTFLVLSPSCGVGKHCPKPCPSPTPPPGTDVPPVDVGTDTTFPPDSGFNADSGFASDLSFPADLSFPTDLSSFPTDLSSFPTDLSSFPSDLGSFPSDLAFQVTG